MRSKVGSSGLLVGVTGILLAACVGAPPDPAVMAADLPEPVSLSADETARRDDLLDATRKALAADDVETADQRVRAALRIDPASAVGRALLGTVWMRRGRPGADLPDLYPWRQAEGELARAAALAPTDPEVAALQSRFFGADGHFSAAAAAAERGLRGDPEDVDCLALAAGWRYELGEESRARPHLEALLRLRPEEPLAIYRYGMCRFELADRARPASAEEQRVDDLRAAVDAFATYAKLIPDDPHGHLAAAQALLVLAQEGAADRVTLAERAAAHASEGARRYPRRAAFPYLLGLARELGGDDAGTAYRDALAIDPTHTGAALREAQRLLAGEGGDGRDEAVRTLLQRLLDADPLRSDLTSRERRRIEEWLEADRAPVRRP